MTAEKHGLGASSFFCIYLALMVIVLPIRWLFSIVAAAAFHEFCHWIVIRIFCKNKTWLRFGVRGAQMTLPPMSRGKELCCILAGPLGSFVLLFFAKIFPRLAICGLLQGIYNLIPMFPLDGGRAVRCITELCFSPRVAEKVLRFWDKTCIVLLLILGFVATFMLKLGLFPLILVFGLLLRKNSLQSGRIGGTIAL